MEDHNCADSESQIIDINPSKLGYNRYLEFQLMYKYRYQIRGLIGFVFEVNNKYSVIKSSFKFILNENESHLFHLKVNSQFVKIFNEVIYLSVFIHSGDEINLNVTFVSAIDEICEDRLKTIQDIWFVTRIHKVKHSGQCFVPQFVSPECEDSSYGQFRDQIKDQYNNETDIPSNFETWD